MPELIGSGKLEEYSILWTPLAAHHSIKYPQIEVVLSCKGTGWRVYLLFVMEVPLAVLADASNVSVEGKLNIFGIFNNISAGSFPALHPHMQLVVAFEADVAEVDKLKDVEIQLKDSDGKDLLMIRGQFTVPRGQPGKKVRINHSFPLSGIVFPKPDDYEFKVLVNGETKTTVSFTVSPLAPNQAKETQR